MWHFFSLSFIIRKGSGGCELIYLVSKIYYFSKVLKEKNISLETRDIKENNPTKEEIKNWLNTYQIPLKKLFNTSGNLYKELHLKDKLGDMSLEEQITLLSSHGMLVKRPLLFLNDKLIIGFDRKAYNLL